MDDDSGQHVVNMGVRDDTRDADFMSGRYDPSASNKHKHHHRRQHHHRTSDSKPDRMRNNDDADVLSLRKRSHQSRSLRDAEEGLEQSGSSSSSSSDSDDGTDAKKKKRKHKNDDTPAPKAPRSPTTKKTKSVRFSDPIRTTAPIFAPLPAYREFDEIQSTPALTMLLIIFAIIVVIGIFTLGIYNHAPQDDDDVHPMIRLAHSVTIQSTTVPSAAVASTTTNSAATDEQ